MQRRKDGLRHKKMSIVAEMLRIPPPSSPLRKHDNDPPVTVAEVTEPIDISTNTVNQQHTTSVGPSPHTFATEIIKDTTTEIAKPRHFESFELGLVDSNGIPVSTRVPSPHAYYVSKNDQVMLSLGHDPSFMGINTMIQTINFTKMKSQILERKYRYCKIPSLI